MSVKFNIEAEGLTRDGSYFNPSADWSVLAWCKSPVVAGGGFFGTAYLFGDGFFTNPYIWLGLSSAGVTLEIWDGSSTNTSGFIAIDFAIWKSFAVTYDQASTTITLYINGVAVSTLVFDISTVTFVETDEWMFTGDFSDPLQIGEIEIFCVRTWQSLLIVSQINNEAFFTNAQITANLLSDTPLDNDTDLTDDSGNGHDWTVVGSGSSRTSPTLIDPVTNNVDAEHAYDLGILPKVVIQNLRATGTTLTAWFVIATPDPAVECGTFGFGDSAAVYAPRIDPFEGPAAAPVSVLGIAALNLPIQFPVNPSTEYFIRALRNSPAANPAYLVLDVDIHIPTTVVAGDIFVNDDTGGFPLAILSGSEDYVVKRFIQPFPNGEEGDISASGLMVVEDADNENIVTYNKLFSAIATFPNTGAFVGCIRSNRGNSKFYVAIKDAPAPVTIKTVSPDGLTLSAVIATLTGTTNLKAIAASNDGSILYFAQAAVNQPIKTWDLIGDIAGPDFQAAVPNYLTSAIIVLPNGNILISYFKATAVIDTYVIHCDPAGTILNTYNYGSADSAIPRLAYALDYNSFWIWRQSTGVNVGINRFINTKISDGSTITTRDTQIYESGVYSSYGATSAPRARYGASFSCPFFILNSNEALAKSGLYTVSGTGSNRGGVNNPLIRHDVNWLDTTVGTSEEVEIPDPHYDTFLAGDE